MRAFRMFLTVAGFAGYFVGMVAFSAVTTGIVHSAVVTMSR